MAELLPEDLMSEILLRLPVKTLVRFRCVSKGWRDLIDSRYFSKSHLNNPPSLLILHQLPENNKAAYDIIDLSSVCNGGSSPQAFNEFPVPGHGRIPYYVGHCNGLVCIADPTGVLLWNPATGKEVQFGLPPQDVWYWGFGYDEDSDDYKVVAMEKARPLVWIYSLKSRSWKSVGEFPYWLVCLGDDGVFVSGALHYPVQCQENYYFSIGALHLGKLEYNLIPMPDFNLEYLGLEYFGALDGRLCVMYSRKYYSDIVVEFDLWTMKEYGVKESWTKLIRCANYPCRLVPLTYLENDEGLLFKVEMKGYEFESGSFVRAYNYSEMVGYEFKTRSFGSRN